MDVNEEPRPSRFVFWCTAPFLVATAALLPLAAAPSGWIGWGVLGVVELLCLCVLLGLYNPTRFAWSWRVVGGLVLGSYVAYLASMLASGQLFGDGRRSTASAFNALCGLVVFGYPGFMYAVFGRLTWQGESNAQTYDEQIDDE